MTEQPQSNQNENKFRTNAEIYNDRIMKEQQKRIAWERNASSCLKSQGSTQEKVREIKKEAVKKLINQIKDHIVEIGLVDGINFYDSEGNLDWSKVNNYIE